MVNSETPTEAQIAYRNDLIEQHVWAHSHGVDQPGTSRRQLGMAATEIALAIMLPMPVTKAQASEQIDALRGNSLQLYGRIHAEWAQAVIDKLACAFGNGAEGIPRVGEGAMLRYGGAPEDFTRLVREAVAG